jgi:hypothetical protein
MTAAALDPVRHARYLAYREAWAYFRLGRGSPLDAEAWARLDDELAALLAAPSRLDAEKRRRVRELRALLLRD